MSVYIKGFPLPNNCGACPLRLAWCRERIYMVTRPERCPLVPVPEHGRLIDADALRHWVLTEMASLDTEDDREFVADRLANELPTIIPTDLSKEVDK